MLLGLIDKLDEAVGAGATVAQIRAQLSTIREQAEAVEARIKELDVQIEALKAQAQQQDVASKQESIEEIGRQLLKLLARPGRTLTLEQMARQLGIEEIKAKYHANKLVETGFIELAGYSPHIGGTVCVLTSKGTAYLVENNLV
jgi:phage shock protein A